MSKKKIKEPRKLDSTEWIITGIGIFLLVLGIYSFVMVKVKMYQIQNGTDFHMADAVVTATEPERKPLTVAQQNEKDKLEAMGLDYTDYEYRYKVWVDFEVEGKKYSDMLYKDTQPAKGDNIEVEVFAVFGKYKVFSEESFGPSAFFSYIVCGIVGCLFGVGLIGLMLLNLHMDNAPIKKQLKEKARRQEEHQKRMEQRRKERQPIVEQEENENL